MRLRLNLFNAMVCFVLVAQTTGYCFAQMQLETLRLCHLPVGDERLGPVQSLHAEEACRYEPNSLRRRDFVDVDLPVANESFTCSSNTFQPPAMAVLDGNDEYHESSVSGEQTIYFKGHTTALRQWSDFSKYRGGGLRFRWRRSLGQSPYRQDER